MGFTATRNNVFMCQGEILRETRSYGETLTNKEKSAEDRWFLIVSNVMWPSDLYEILSGFLFLVRKFSNLSNEFGIHPVLSCNY